MNKKIICFILILSFFVPFFPTFDYFVSAAEPTVSMNDYMDSLGFYWDSSDNLWKPKATATIGKQIEFVLADHGYVIRDNPMSVVIDYIANQIGVPYQGNGYTVSDAENIVSSGVVSDNIVNYSVTYAENNISYYSRSVIHVSDFLQVIGIIGTHQYNIDRLNILQTQLKNLINGSSSNVYIYNEDSNRMSVTGTLYAISRDDFSDYSFYVKDINTASTDFLKNGNGVFVFGTVTNSSGFNRPSSMWVVSGNSVLNSLMVLQSDYKNRYYPNSDTYFSSPTRVNLTSNFNGFYDGLASGIDSYGFNMYRGSLFIVSDSIDTFSFPIFKDYTVAYSFYSGDAPIYSFDKSIDLGQYGEDIDYSKLYDIISTEVRHSSGNVLNAINNVANNYLQQQIDLLHDINNALNDGNGQSWLRRIYGILDYNFPLTLTALQDLKVALQNLSVGGGSADLTYTNQVLDQINDKLGILIDQPFSDATVEDMEDLKNLALNKFPFCVFSDIVAISVILNQPPQEPEWSIPMKLPGSESANNIEIDLSWYEEIRDIVYAVFIFIFIIGLLALSVKIFQAVKD